MISILGRRPLTRAQARELALALMRRRGADAMAQVGRVEGPRLAGALRRALESKGIVVDRDVAEGVAEAVQEMCPKLRDDAAPNARTGLHRN